MRPQFKSLKEQIVIFVCKGTELLCQYDFICVLEMAFFFIKIVLTYCEKKCSSNQEKLLKFEAEGREFAKFLRSLEQFIQTVKRQNFTCS